MNLNLRLFMAYFLVIGIGVFILLNTFISELRPGLRQSTEDTLVDMANLLAEVVTEDFNSGRIQGEKFRQSLDRFLDREFQVDIYDISKQSSNLRIYMTNAQGIVVFDSDHTAVGEDYSQWNDVYLTLKGSYGARSTRMDPNDEFSTVMYVAAPIYSGSQIIGSLTIAKPDEVLEPFLEIAQGKIKRMGVIMVIVSTIVGALLSFWLTGSIRKLYRYAEAIRSGKRAVLPEIGEKELAALGHAMEAMRRELEGKDYVEEYVHSLTHELKSPVSAIKGASELIDEQMPIEVLERFKNNIQHEVSRIEELINRLLELASIERRDILHNIEPVNLSDLIDSVLTNKAVLFKQKSITIKQSVTADLIVKGEKFLILQAIDNLLQNAIDFSPADGVIQISLSEDRPNHQIQLKMKDQGPGIPDYARKKLYDRFYSLPRPGSDKKSSGLGLSFVKQVAELHAGSISLDNDAAGGVIATLTLPV